MIAQHQKRDPNKSIQTSLGQGHFEGVTTKYGINLAAFFTMHVFVCYTWISYEWREFIPQSRKSNGIYTLINSNALKRVLHYKFFFQLNKWFNPMMSDLSCNSQTVKSSSEVAKFSFIHFIIIDGTCLRGFFIQASNVQLIILMVPKIWWTYSYIYIYV